jgi:hypothetical protein
MKNLKLFSLGIAMLITFMSFGQEKTITGIVSDASGPLPGANVVVKGTKTGTQTNINGKYSIKTQPKDTLLISFLGMETQFIPVGDKKTVNLKMENSKVQLKETYGDPIPSGRKISREDLKNSKTTTAVEEKEVNRTQPDSNKKIKYWIRSPKDGVEALIIVDEMIVNDNILKKINPNNIASVNILKGIKPTEIYGVKGKNGAIVIQTKNLSRRELRKLKKQSELLRQETQDSIKIRN